MPAGLFPGERVIPVRLDAADPLPGPAACWEVLDAVVLDAAAMAAVDDNERSALLAGGVTLAAVGEGPPDAAWPWRRRGTAWVLARVPAGPTGAVEPDAYGPVESWSPGWSAAVRGGVVAVAGGVVLATIGLLCVVRPGPRAAVVGVTVLCGVATVGIVAWRSALDPVAHGGGDVTVAGGGWAQRDAWVYDRGRSAADVDVEWKGWTHPAFASAAAAEGARVTVAADGRLGFAVHLPAGRRWRSCGGRCGPGGPPAVTGGHAGRPCGTVAPLYRSAGDRLAGETAAGPGRWPGVSIERP